VNSISHALNLSDLRFMSLGPIIVDIRSIVQTLFVFVTLIVLYLRYRQDQFRQVALEQDMASARRMQEQLLGGKALYVPGFDLEAVYLPAKEVGGDFYRVVPLEDGSLLVVVGDVSGKGLDAAMLVAAILGSLANETHRNPASLLGYLNKAVAGRTGGGFITACCARFYPDGQAVIANAGHISPYLNGSEIELENGLPLGINPDATYSETSIPTDGTFTFVSDGVVEARAASGELLGFERTGTLTNQPAAEVAAAAQRWGQEDDITVLTVTPLPA
jgi:serine phosphatase RsbU (regulator of sigma subunit)